VPHDAAIIRWALIEIPSAIEYRLQPGRRLRVNHLPAKIFKSTRGCAGVAGTTIRAANKLSPEPYDYSFVALNACTGPQAAPGDVRAIEALFRTTRSARDNAAHPLIRRDRKGSGVRRYTVSRSLDDPQFVMIDLDFDSYAEAQGCLPRWNEFGLVKAKMSCRTRPRGL
jgi:hypothetical protein